MEDEELARLLSGRDGPSVLEQEAGFKRVMRTLERQRAPRRWRWWAPACAAAAAIAAVLVMARPASTPMGPAGEPPFQARGGAAGDAALQVLCVDHGTTGRCPSGGRLAFVAESGTHDYLALFARRVDGLIIWYFPSAQGTSVALEDTAGRPLQHGIELGAEQPPGAYELFAVFSSAPLTRADIKRDLGPQLQTTKHRVVRQQLVVEHAP